MDAITIGGIRAYGKHGAYEGERDSEQPFDLELRLELDLHAAEASDDLGDTINYDHLCTTVTGIVRDRSFALLERLAGAIVEAIFADARIARASVAIGKPGILSGATATVTLQRENPRYRAAFP